MAKSMWEKIASFIIEHYDEKDLFTRDELGGEAIINEVIDKNIHASTWKALINNQVIILKDGNNYSRNPEFTITQKVSKKHSDNHNKSNNQDFGKYFELCISEISKGAIMPPEWTHYDFSEKEKNTIFRHAKMMRDYLGKDKVFEWTGNHTVSGIGDLLDENGEKIEIKYVGGDGSGTYFNNTIYSLLHYNENFDIRNYLRKYNLYTLSEQLFGDLVPISTVNKSLISNQDKRLKLITSDKEEEQDPVYSERYRRIYIPIAEQAMEEFNTDVYQYFCENPSQFAIFFDNLLNKRKEQDLKNNTCSAPDKYVCFNYFKETIHEVDMTAMRTNIQTFNLRRNKKGIIVNDMIRINFSWKNGYCLSNPAIYVFPLKKEDNI